MRGGRRQRRNLVIPGESLPTHDFDRAAAGCLRLNIAAVRSEPGQARLLPLNGARRVFSLNRAIMRAL